MSFQGKKNRYTCELDEKHVITTVDKDAGTTPFMTVCEDCKAIGLKSPQPGFRHPVMYSSFYRVPQGYPATHEWYRPDAAETSKQNPSVRQHIEMGGLLLRKIGEPRS